jgi:CheY-like chemotaxis protein
MANGRELRILLVEDDEDHAGLIRLVLTQGPRHAQVKTVSNGEEAVAYLFHRGAYLSADKAPRPDLILLDIKLPGITGIEVLRQIKESPDHTDIPVVMLTSSSMKEDIRESYRHHANSYILKPFGFEDFKRKLTSAGFYWMEVNQAPC